MSRQQIWDKGKVGQEEEVPPYRQIHEDYPTTPTAVTSRAGGWFTSLRHRLGFDVEEDFRLTRRPLLTTPEVLHPQPSDLKHTIHTFFCDPEYHSTEGQEDATATAHLALCWYRSAGGYLEIPFTWRGHLADDDVAVSDEISVSLHPHCPTRRAYTRIISLEYQRGSHSEEPASQQGWEPESLVLRPRDSTAEARVQVSVSSWSSAWLANEPADNFSNLISGRRVTRYGSYRHGF
ncbi:hypothetical protein B0H66DRAFT_526325 [Apodospora peruviana]|uniref:Uncharacterized protein n=1 Tax=Apodospora peruviana TaxID=516989 RepID=A0AAE0IPP2_9PEZI|nr:hypothetical protein B0H66DRAFT_526325 [Apodospora peruviana]